MLYETLQEYMVQDDAGGNAPPRPAPVSGVLPMGVAFCERAAAIFRAALREQGLDDWRIFHGGDLDLDDIDDHLAALGKDARWHPLAPATSGGEAVSVLKREHGAPALQDMGWVRFDRYRVALARWHWATHDGAIRLILAAAPTVEHYRRLHKRVVRLRCERAASVWQIVAGYAYRDRRRPRVPVADDELLLDPSVRARVETDVIRFFDERVKELYASLKVPYRRGVLLHGPPGNGKTSLVRLIGAALPRVPALILRPYAQFDSDDLEEVLRRWRRQAPAILVIEDLDWLLERVNVSTFLNLVDGIDNDATGGLLLIATTNHPQKLDPAVNNRPGRFDVVIEVPSPDEPLRRAVLTSRAPDVTREIVDRIVSMTAGLSFSHLQEILRLSGLLVIREGRATRGDADVLRAAELVTASHEDAVRGFPPKCELRFGLQHVRKTREAAR